MDSSGPPGTFQPPASAAPHDENRPYPLAAPIPGAALGTNLRAQIDAKAPIPWPWLPLALVLAPVAAYALALAAASIALPLEHFNSLYAFQSTLAITSWITLAVAAVDVRRHVVAQIRRARLPITRYEMSGPTNWSLGFALGALAAVIPYAAVPAAPWAMVATYAVLRNPKVRISQLSRRVGFFETITERNRALRRPGTFSHEDLKRRRRSHLVQVTQIVGVTVAATTLHLGIVIAAFGWDALLLR